MTDAINSHSRRMYNAQKKARADLATPAPAVKVKALVWVKGLYWTTDDDGGRREGIKRALHCWTADQYRIVQQDSPDGLFILRGLPKGCVSVFPYFEPASAAAQADYEARVTPAMEAANPLDDPRVKALVDALTLYIYETTHLSEEESDGSHWCKISEDCLARARAALIALEENK